MLAHTPDIALGIWFVILMGMLQATMQQFTSLMLAGVGEAVVERSGVVNIGVEGLMLAGAFTGALVASACLPAVQDHTLHAGAAAALAWSAAIAAGLLGGALLAIAVVWFRVDQIVAGLSINLICAGLTGTLFTVCAARHVTLGGLGFEPICPAGTACGDVPIVGPVLLQRDVTFYAALLLLAAVSVWMHRTRSGLALRACGENPAAVDTSGWSVVWMRTGACLFGGSCAGAAGGTLSLAYTHSYHHGISGGLGFLALAMVIFGRYRPLLVASAALLFSLLKSLDATLQANQRLIAEYAGDIDINTLYPLFTMLPYLLTLVALAGLTGGIKPPAALGTPYER